jgi:GR25 family glycosyltransferase involved in LPS biosynthesis
MFDRVVLISLKQRTDRREAFKLLQEEKGWQLPQVQIFDAIHGDTVGPADGYFAGGGAFGCVLPGGEIQGRVQAASKAFYSGEAVEIVLRSGIRLPLTINHPILTDQGYVAAGHVKQGDYLACYRPDTFGAKNTSANNNKQHAPALIEEIFNSSAKQGTMRWRKVRSNLDFYGDGEFIQGNIDIVNINSTLWGRSNSKAGLFGPASDLDAVFHQQAFQSKKDESKLIGQLVQRFPSNVFFDDVIQIKRFHYDGPVYDLKTSTGYFILNSQHESSEIGCIVSNCRQSHLAVLERALMDEVGSLLVLEDDVEWRQDTWKKLQLFMRLVPTWQALWLGGQDTVPAQQVKPGICRCLNTQRTHAYAIKGTAIKSLLKLWYTTNTHIDHVLGPWQASHKVYRPDPFLFGQTASMSDICGRVNPSQWWNQPAKNAPVVFLDCSQEVAAVLRGHGFHTGYDRDPETDIDVKLPQAMKDKESLRKWLDTILWEAASQEGQVATVWGCGTLEQVQAAYPNVLYIAGQTPEECLKKASGLKLVKTLTSSHVLVLRSSRQVADHLTGFFRGAWIDYLTGADMGIREAASLEGENRIMRLRQWYCDIRLQCEKMKAVPMMFYDKEITLEECQEAFCDKVVLEITANTVAQVREKWREVTK